MIKEFFFCWLLLIITISCGQKPLAESPWNDIFYNSSELFDHVINHKDKYEIQIIYTEIDNDSEGSTVLTHHYFNINDSVYFYPASTVKMPVAFLALEYINELSDQDDRINEYSTIRFDSIASPQTKEYIDSTSSTGFPNVAHYVEKIFSVSDNNAYNRLYELLGQDFINTKLKEKGIFTKSKIIHRVGVSGFDRESNKYTNPYQIVDAKDEILFEQNELYALYNDYPIVHNTIKGVGKYDELTEEIVADPFDFSHKNFINLKELQSTLERVLFPQIFERQERFDLTKEQYQWLRQIMQKLPKEYKYLKKNPEYYDSYVKFFMFGDSKQPIPDHIEISNKVGWAYGYLTDCAYIKDTKNGIEFFLTATIHVNENQIYNDGIYEYDSIGIPFLSELGRLVYQYELTKTD